MRLCQNKVNMIEFIRKLKFSWMVVLILLGTTTAYTQDSVFVYKKVDTLSLKMDVYFPPEYRTGINYPAIVFFFGGGWNSGSTAQFEQQAKYFSGKGMICFTPEYRVKQRHQTTPFESLEDAKSAMRYVRTHARELGIDTTRIIASGGSAGGHLAAAVALIDGYNGNSDDLTVSCKPAALALFNPVIDNGPGGYGYERIGEDYKDFSPLHNIHRGAPATIIILGDNDKHIPVETVQYFKTVMEKVGSRCEIKLYKGQEHGFFNYGKGDNTYFLKTLHDMEIFINSLSGGL